MLAVVGLPFRARWMAAVASVSRPERVRLSASVRAWVSGVGNEMGMANLLTEGMVCRGDQRQGSPNDGSALGLGSAIRQGEAARVRGPEDEADQTIRGRSAALTAAEARKAPNTSMEAMVASASSGVTSSAMEASPRTRTSVISPAA